METISLIFDMCAEVGRVLAEKNIKYGDSALHPCRIFSTASPLEQLRVRIDDKLSRIAAATNGMVEDEDTLLDLIGYLILYRIALRQQQQKLND